MKKSLKKLLRTRRRTKGRHARHRTNRRQFEILEPRYLLSGTTYYTYTNAVFEDLAGDGLFVEDPYAEGWTIHSPIVGNGDRGDDTFRAEFEGGRCDRASYHPISAPYIFTNPAVFSSYTTEGTCTSVSGGVVDVIVETLSYTGNILFKIDGDHFWEQTGWWQKTGWEYQSDSEGVSRKLLVVENPIIRGTVYEDLNGNGKQDEGEPPLADREVCFPFDNTARFDCESIGDVEGQQFRVKTVTTDADGRYELKGAQRNVSDLVVRVEAAPGVDEITFQDVIVTGAASRQVVEDHDIGVFKRLQVSGNVYLDHNGDGDQDPDEDAWPGALVYLDGAIEDYGASAVSGADGHYVLEESQLVRGVGPGTVRIFKPFVYDLTEGADGYPTTSGEDFAGANFGLFAPSLVYGQVFDDLNGNGQWDHDLERPFAGARIALDLLSDGSIDREVFSDEMGLFDFIDVGPGTHRVTPVLRDDQRTTVPSNLGAYVITMLSGEPVGPFLFGLTDVPPLIVNSSESRVDIFPGDKRCDTGVRVDGVPECTLWAAIQEANAQPGRQRILFDPKITVINIANPLPEITDPVKIIGGASRVVLLGNTSGSGLKISGGYSTISGLVIAGFDGIGIELKSNGTNVIENCEIIGSDAEGIVIRDGSNQNTIRANFIGSNTDGADRGNELAGIRIYSNSNVIGGDDPADGNVIAFNQTGVVVEQSFNRIDNNVIVSNREHGVWLIDGHNNVRRNHIGTDKEGQELGNMQAGVQIDSEMNTIGGDQPLLGNVIAYNKRGIEVTLVGENTIDNNEILINREQGIVLRDGGDKNIVRRNYIGIDRVGFKFSNGSAGIWIASSNNVIGGIGDGEGNTIAYNGVQDDAVGSNTSSGYGVVVATLPDEENPSSSTMSGNAILGNSIYLNGGPGIDLGHDGATANDTGTRAVPPNPDVPPDLDDGPNQLQNSPEVLTSFDGQERFVRLRSTPNQRFRIEIFASPANDVMLRNEGRTYLSSVNVTTDAQGLTAFKMPTLDIAADKQITATATRLEDDGRWGATSEFSNYPERNIDDCTNTDLQKTKDGIWKSILRRIDAATADDYAAWQRLRQLALDSIRPQTDGCILATESTLRRLDELVTTQTSVQGELGWWEDFWDIMADDYDRVEGLMQAAWDGVWDAAVAQYDAAPTFDEVWADISSLSDPDVRHELLLSIQESTTETIEQIRFTLENAVVFLGRHGNELVWDAVVNTLDKASNIDTYTNIVADLFAFEALSKAFDPNVPVEERVANWLFGYMQVVGTLEGAASLAKGLNAARAGAFTKELASEITDDPNAQKAFINRVVQQKDAALKRAESSVFGKTQPGIYRLKDGDIIDEDLLWTTGYTKQQADAISAIAKGKYTLKFRPTNMDSARWIKRGSLPKPVTIKAKTISEIDVYLGYHVDDLGLVGLKDPKNLLDPTTLDACKNPISKFCDQLIERYQKHKLDYADLKKELGDVYEVDSNGVVKHIESKRTVAGDIDPIEFFHADGTRVTGEEYDRLLAELKEASIQHGGEVYFVQDMIDGMAKTCVEMPLKCKEPGSEEWQKVVQKASDFTAGQRVKYASREEVAVEFGVDGVLRKRNIEVLPDILTGGEGEDAITPTNYKLEEFKFFLEQTDIDIRRDHLTTLNSFFAAIQERSDSQAVLAARLLQKVEIEASISEAAFEDLSAADFVELVESEPTGLRIDLVVSGAAAEGEDSVLLTAERILDKIRTEVGDSGMTNYRVEDTEGGGFIVHSRTAQQRPFDVNGDGLASPIDALIIINSLNAEGPQRLSIWPLLPELRTDVNFDGFRSPIDVLLVINFLNAAALAPIGEGEGTTWHLTAPIAAPLQPMRGECSSMFGSMKPSVKSNAETSENKVAPIWPRSVDTTMPRLPRLPQSEVRHSHRSLLRIEPLPPAAASQ